MYDNLIQDEKTVWYVGINSDLTEGRGTEVIIGVTELPETARRIAHKRNVMGSDGNVFPGQAYKINGRWYVRGDITQPSAEEMELAKVRLAQAERERIKQEIYDELVYEMGVDPDKLRLLMDNGDE